MKKVSRRALFALALAIVLAAGTLAFCIKYAVNADKWVTFSGSPHVYTGTNLTGGKIYDRTGARILNTTDGRVYSSDAAVRAATVHLLGDRYGYISAPLLGNFAEQMIGYDKITGLSEASKGTASARLTISADVLQALGSYHGTVGVYNYKTGEILCAVTSPSYDPDNIPDIAGDETGDYDGVYLNRFFDAAYTPGSIFKLVTSAAALEADAASKDQTHTCTGETIIGGQEIICMGKHGTLSMTQALAHSCNVYYGELAAALGKDKLQAAADRLGLNGTLRCDGYTARSTVDLSDADEGSVAWAGIGQYTDQVTALQFLRFMGVIAGGGEAAEPYLMQKISRAGQTVYEAKTETTGQLLSAATATTLGGMMRSAKLASSLWDSGRAKSLVRLVAVRRADSLRQVRHGRTGKRPGRRHVRRLRAGRSLSAGLRGLRRAGRLRQPDRRPHRRQSPHRLQNNARYAEPEQLRSSTQCRNCPTSSVACGDSFPS